MTNNLPDNNLTPIVKKTLDLYKLLYGILATFPKRDKYILGAHLENCLLQILDNLLQASAMPKTEKWPKLILANSQLEMLKIFIRLARELKIIDDKKYLALEQRVAEIGRMLGGWMKFLK